MWLSFRTAMMAPRKVTRDQQEAGDLLGPAERIVQHVAGEELQEDDEGKRPEYAQDQRIVPLVAGQVFVLGVNQVGDRTIP